MYQSATILVMSQVMLSQPTSILISILLPWILHSVRRVKWIPWAHIMNIHIQLLKLQLRHLPLLLPPMMHPSLLFQKQFGKKKGVGSKKRSEAFNFV